MEYVLNFRIEGLAEATQQLKEMLQLLGQISSGKVSFSGGSASGIGSHSGGGVQIISPQQLQNLERASRGMQNIKKEVQSLSSAMAGGGNMGSLKNMPESLRQKIFAQHPELKKEFDEKFLKVASLPMDEKARRERMRDLKDRAAFMKDLTFGMMPLTNPGSPWGTLFATRQIFSAMTTQHGQGLLGKFGMVGTTGAGLAAGGIVAGLTAVGAGLMAFRKALDGAKGAIQQAFGIYSGSAQSGLSAQYYTRRQSLAGIFGIQGNPNQVFLFGAAVAQVESKISSATTTIAKNSKPLGEFEVAVRVMKLNFEAAYSSLAVKLLPAMNAWVNALNALATIKPPKWMDSIAKGALQLNPFSSMLANLTNVLGVKYGTGSMFGAGGLPGLGSFMKQLPVSSWEKMGLQIGGGSEMLNYTKQIAQNTRKMAVAIARSGGNPMFAVPSFIMNNP